jgi:beta-exotoxin I transport system ATP-binding protein
LRSRQAELMAAAIRAEHLTKFYGEARGILELDLEVQEGEIFGFLGPNGAGKTTTIRLLLDLIRPSSGRAEVFGLETRRDAVAIRRRIGYLPGDLRLYERLTGRELLDYFGHLRGLDGLGNGPALAERLAVEIDRPVRDLSRGNRQKIGLLQAFMHQPDLLILDEPTSGLDPLIQQVFYDLVREATAEGRTVFLSSHNLAEVQHVADRVGWSRRESSSSSRPWRHYEPAPSRGSRRPSTPCLRAMLSPGCPGCASSSAGETGSC